MPLGRVILKSISDSKKISQLKTDGARLLYTWLLTHLDVNGCYAGDAEIIKGKIFTRLKRTIKLVEEYLKDMEKNNLIIRYEINGDTFLNVPDFVEKQPSLNPDREGKTNIPLPPQELLQSYYRVNPLKVNISKVNISKVNISKDISSDLKDKSELKILFNHSTSKWENITDKHITLWNKAYPECRVDVELAKMKAWILENGARGHKSNWGKFVTNWLSRAQDRGGTKS